MLRYGAEYQLLLAPYTYDISQCPTRDHGAEFNFVVVRETRIAWYESAVADDQDSLRVDLETAKQGVSDHRPLNLNLATRITENHLHLLRAFGEISRALIMREE